MSKLAKTAFVLFLLVYFGYVVLANAPAQLVAGAVVKAAPGISLGGVRGTVWDGRAGAASAYVLGKHFDLGSLNWKVNVPALLTMRLCMDIETGLFRGNACRGLSGQNTIKQFMLDEFPVGSFNDMIPVQLGGSGNITLNKLVVNDAGHVRELEGNVTWMRARGDGGGGWYPLGSFAADLSANGDGGIKAKVTDLDGAFEVDIEGEVGLEQMPRAAGTIKPRPEAPQILIESLMLVATDQLDDGTFKLSWPIGGG